MTPEEKQQLDQFISKSDVRVRGRSEAQRQAFYEATVSQPPEMFDSTDKPVYLLMELSRDSYTEYR